MISFGFLTAFVFRSLTDKFTVTQDLKPDSPQEKTAKKVDDTYQKEQGNSMEKILKQMNNEEKIEAACKIINKGNEKALDLLIEGNFDFNTSYKGFPLIYYVIRKGAGGDSMLKKLMEKGLLKVPENFSLIEQTPIEFAKKTGMSDESIRFLGGVPDEKPVTVPPQPVYLRREESLNQGAQNIPQFQMQPPPQVPANDENQVPTDFEKAKTAFQGEFRNENLNIERLKQLYKAHPDLANEQHNLLATAVNKKDLAFLKFLIEDMHLEAKHEDMLSFIYSGWNEGLEYLSLKVRPSSLINEISDSYRYTLFYAAKFKGVPADILMLLKPSEEDLERYFLTAKKSR